ncbi:MAG: NAD-dependent epimerase/dehydratase family protein [Pseudomonadota bacterium]
MTDRPGSVLIIGGGFIGSALARRFRKNDVIVHLLAREAAIPHKHFDHMYTGGLSNIGILNRVLPEVDTVIHAASATTPGVSSRIPSIEAESNIEPTLRFLDVLQQFNHVQLVYLSSGGTVYGNTSDGPVQESAEISPLSYYGAGKVAIETFLQTYNNNHHGGVTILRPSNIYGPGQPYYRGFGVIRTMFKHIREGTAMEIWGDGSAIRDYLYIDDMVDACLSIAGTNTSDYNVFNVGSGIGYSLNSLIEHVETASGATLDKTYRQTRATDVSSIILDSTKIADFSGWQPLVSLEGGLDATWKWISANE